MIFKKEFVPLILSGQKTQTRRFWKGMSIRVHRIYQCRTDYSSKPPFAHILITGIKKCPISEMTAEDVAAEGFPGKTPEDFLKTFMEINKIQDETAKRYLWEFGDDYAGRVLYRIDFEVVTKESQ